MINISAILRVLHVRRRLVLLVVFDLPQLSGSKITIMGENQLKLVLPVDPISNRLSPR